MGCLLSARLGRAVGRHPLSFYPHFQQEILQTAVALDILFDYLRDKSSIVKTWAMQAIWDLAAADAKSQAQIIPLIEELTQVGTAPMRARGGKLLRQPKVASRRSQMIL